jgi:D-alanyl-D-alanine dipeptidase
MPLSDTDYELLDRIDRGERIFHEAGPTLDDSVLWGVQVDRLLSLRARQWIQVPDRYISRGPGGEWLAIGPCELTPEGRKQLERDRRLGPRRGLGRLEPAAEVTNEVPSSEKEAVAVIPGPVSARRRGALALGAVALAFLGVAAGLWLLWGRQRPWLVAPTPARQQESAAVAAVQPDSVAPSAQPPADTGLRRSEAMAEPPLVDVRSVDSTIEVDLRYATSNNFTGAPLPGYEAPRALLRLEAANALGRVQARLRDSGLGLRILDAYRPVRASLAMVEWAERTGHRTLLESGFIAPRSRHNLGVAVDLTLVELATGAEVPTGTSSDTAPTPADSANASPETQRYREILVRTMESEGFSSYPQAAWWHFSYPVEGAVPLDQVIR